MGCSWPMYRRPYNGPYNGTFQYHCGLYSQSNGQQCGSNHVDGRSATQFMLSCIRQKITAPAQVAKLTKKLHLIAARETAGRNFVQSNEAPKAELAKVAAELQIAKRNMTLAQNPDQFAAMATVFDDLVERHTILQADVAKAEAARPVSVDVETEVNKALSRKVDARLFLRFKTVRPKKRVVQRVAGGVVTFGATPPPIEIYQGLTARKDIKEHTAAVDAATLGDSSNELPGSFPSGRKDMSIGNANRGDKI
jgi:hypothetical protein